MANYMIFKGLSNMELGAVITDKPSIPNPVERGEAIVIPGRNGSVWKSQGVWDDIMITVALWIKPGASLQAVKQWLTGAGLLSFCEGDNAFYKARIDGNVTFTPYTFSVGTTATVTFVCAPFRYAQDTEIEITASGRSAPNIYPVYSEPIITVYGSGDAVLDVGGTSIILSDIQNGMKLDTELQEAYIDDTLLNDHMVGPFPILTPGDNIVSWEGNITRLVIDPRWRTI